MYSGFLRFPSPDEIWCSESGSGDFQINSGDRIVSCEKKELNSESGTCVQGVIGTLHTLPTHLHSNNRQKNQPSFLPQQNNALSFHGEDPHLTRIIIPIRADSNIRSVCRQRHGYSLLIIGRFSSDVLANLLPHQFGILHSIDAHATHIITILPIGVRSTNGEGVGIIR